MRITRSRKTNGTDIVACNKSCLSESPVQKDRLSIEATIVWPFEWSLYTGFKMCAHLHNTYVHGKHTSTYTHSSCTECPCAAQLVARQWITWSRRRSVQELFFLFHPLVIIKEVGASPEYAAVANGTYVG